MAEVPPGTSVDAHTHSALTGLLQRVQHPTKMLRRTQSHNKGLGSGLGSHSNPGHDSQHDISAGADHSDHFGIAGALRKRWASYMEGLSFGSDHHHHHHHHNHHFLFHNHMNQQPHSHHHHHHRHGHHSHHFRFGPWRRWGSVRERPHHKEHSLASVELGSWTARASSRRGSALPLPFCAGLSPVEAARKAETLEGVQAAIIKLFQRKPLKENELGTLQESVRALSEAEAGALIYDYYKDQLLKKGMVILREKIKNEQGSELMRMLGETWDYFFTEILPTLQALMYPLAESSKDMDIRNTTLLEYRNIVVLKVGLKEAVDAKKYQVPANITQMLLVLQGLHDPTFLSKEQLDLERLVACVVVPFLGSRGLYDGGPEPVTKANYRPSLPSVPVTKPKITITVSDAGAEDYNTSSAKSPRLLKTDHHPIASPSAMRKLHEPSSSHGVISQRLKPVMEDLDVGRRHSIVGT